MPTTHQYQTGENRYHISMNDKGLWKHSPIFLVGDKNENTRINGKRKTKINRESNRRSKHNS